MSMPSALTPVARAVVLLAALSPVAPAADPPVVEWYQPGVDGGWVSDVDAQSHLSIGDLDTTGRYAPDGPLLWSQDYEHPFGHTNLHDLQVDSLGHVIRGGYVEGQDGAYLVVKYDTDGTLLWVSLADIALNEQAFYMRLDEDDNIYLFGEADQAPVTKRWLTVKFDPAGVVQWHRWGAFAEPTALAVRDGQVVVTGEASGGDFVTTSYAYDGTTNFDVSYQPGSSGSNHVAIGPDGQVAVCGWGQSSLPPGSAGTVVLYDATGNEQWAAEYNGPWGGIEIFKKVAIDGAGNVIAAGYGLSSTPSDAWSVVKFDPVGRLLWANTYDHVSFTGFEEARALTLGHDDAVYVGGLSDQLSSCGGFGSLEGHVVKWSADGELEWAEHVVCGSHPTRIHLDPSGGIYAVGMSDVLRLREPFAHLGSGLAGVSGTPSLSGAGAFSAGSSVSLTLSDAAPNAQAFLLLGTTALYAPFKGGVLVPDPTAPAGLALPVVTNGVGGLSVSGTWPAGIPAGVLVFDQVWVADAAAPKGFSASNALVSATL
jgi:hypothetical protein